MGIEKVIMLSIAICDDEPFCLDKENSIISNYLNECKEKFKVDVFTSPASLLSAVSSNEYDLVMLDVEMPDIDGIEVAHKVHEINDKTQIAFISAYMKYASRGYHVNAFRYILKDEDMEVYIRECLKQILDKQGLNNKIINLKFTIGERNIRVNDIVYLKSEGNYTSFVMFDSTNKEVLKQKKPIKKVTAAMTKYNFVAVNSGESVNLHHVKEVRGSRVVLDNGESLLISLRKYNDFLNAYKMYERVERL